MGAPVERCGPARQQRARPGKGIDMGDTSLIRAALLIALITAFGLAATGRAPATEVPAATEALPLTG